jgi:hypothetical protein
MDKSFLLLFFKKEALASLTYRNAALILATSKLSGRTSNLITDTPTNAAS